MCGHGESVGFVAVQKENNRVLVQGNGIVAREVPSTIQAGPIYHGLRFPGERIFLVIGQVNRVPSEVCPGD